MAGDGAKEVTKVTMDESVKSEQSGMEERCQSRFGQADCGVPARPQRPHSFSGPAN